MVYEGDSLHANLRISLSSSEGKRRKKTSIRIFFRLERTKKGKEKNNRKKRKLTLATSRRLAEDDRTEARDLAGQAGCQRGCCYWYEFERNTKEKGEKKSASESLEKTSDGCNTDDANADNTDVKRCRRRVVRSGRLFLVSVFALLFFFASPCLPLVEATETVLLLLSEDRPGPVGICREGEKRNGRREKEGRVYYYYFFC